MSDFVIQVENLSKQYRLGQVGTGTLTHDLNRMWHRVRGKEDPYLKIGEVNDRTRKGTGKYVWALKDIDFGVRRGEVLGIIGKNGAGKSTLLKILSRTTAPSGGSVKIKGRVASLLEVGTGFHPDLSGRDNVFLNGAILGMSRQEIKRKFDEIVDFAGVEKYIDTPVKRYSSGMYVRLAFGVAAHLESEILIVDEVLAVGDSEFQKKCLGKMEQVSQKDGRTVLFVSHNLGTVLQLCENCLLLRNGMLAETGHTSRVVEKYYDNLRSDVFKKVNSESEIYFKEVFTCDRHGVAKVNFAHKEDIHLRLRIGVNKFDPIYNIGLAFLAKDKKRVFTVNRLVREFYQSESSEITVDFIIDGGFIAANEYSFLLALNTPTGLIYYDYLEDVCPIKVYDDGTEFAFAEGTDYGHIVLQDKWNLVDSR